MADEASAPEASAEAAPEPANTPEVPAGAEKPDAVKNALNAERTAAREAKKRADAAEAKVREYEEANATELEKLTGKATKAEQRAAEAEAKLLRYEVAQQKEVPAKLVPLLTAAKREDLEAQADLILSNSKPAEPEFDGGAREPAQEPKTPEQAHNDLLMGLFGRPKQL